MLNKSEELSAEQHVYVITVLFCEVTYFIPQSNLVCCVHMLTNHLQTVFCEDLYVNTLFRHRSLFLSKPKSQGLSVEYHVDLVTVILYFYTTISFY